MESSLYIAVDDFAFDAVGYPMLENPPPRDHWWHTRRVAPTRLAVDLPPAYFGMLFYNKGGSWLKIYGGRWFCQYSSHPCLVASQDLYSGRVPSTAPSNATSWMELFIYWYGVKARPSIQEGKET